jgi:hypothetical protein
MGVWPLSRVELMLWVQGVTIKWYQSQVMILKNL